MRSLNFPFVRSMLRRELRTSRGRLLLYGSCMALGITALVGLEGLRATTRDAIDAQAAALLGADLRITGRAPIPETVRVSIDNLATGESGATTQVSRFGSMALAPKSGRSRLVDVQAAQENFPLRGTLDTVPEGAWAAVHEADELRAVVDPSLLIQLDLSLGDELKLGTGRFRIVGQIKKAPGSFGVQTQIAPRVLISRDALEATGLITPGSLVEYLLFAQLPRESADAWLSENKSLLENSYLRTQTVQEQQNELNRGFGLLTRFLGLVGLAALALGGVGVAAGVRVLVREKLETTAVLRSLGASSRDILAIYGLLAMCLGLVSGVVGALLGVVLQWSFPALLQDLLPVAVQARFEPAAIGTGIILGLGVTLIFSAGPLIDLGRVPPLRSLRSDFSNEPVPLAGRVGLACILALSLVLVSCWQAPTILVGLWFSVGLAAVLGILAATARLLAMTARKFVPRQSPYWLRQGLANLFRPRNHTTATALTVGFGLFLVATLHGVQSGILEQIAMEGTEKRPNLILFDVQPDQVEPLEDFLRERGAEILEQTPIVSARLGSIGGETVSQRIRGNPDDRESRWALLREYRLSWAPDLRPSESIVAGRWWTKPGAGNEEPIPVSLEADLAAALDVEVGDSITWDIQGVPVESVVGNLRNINWGTLATNFFALFPPGLIEQAPSTTVFLADVEGAEIRGLLQRDLVRDFPNVSVLDASLILQSVDLMMQRVSMAVRALALFALATGFLILVAAATMARGERTREILLLRTLGASSQTLRRVVTTEAVALGALSALVGTLLSIFATWALMFFVFESPFSPPLMDYTLLALTSFAISALLGGASGRPLRNASPLLLMREGASGS